MLFTDWLVSSTASLAPAHTGPSRHILLLRERHYIARPAVWLLCLSNYDNSVTEEIEDAIERLACRGLERHFVDPVRLISRHMHYTQPVIVEASRICGCGQGHRDGSEFCVFVNLHDWSVGQLWCSLSRDSCWLSLITGEPRRCIIRAVAYQSN